MADGVYCGINNDGTWTVRAWSNYGGDLRPVYEKYGFNIIAEQTDLNNNKFFDVRLPAGWHGQHTSESWINFTSPDGTTVLQHFYDCKSQMSNLEVSHPRLRRR